jgi:hypothetical protein
MIAPHARCGTGSRYAKQWRRAFSCHRCSASHVDTRWRLGDRNLATNIKPRMRCATIKRLLVDGGPTDATF